jgi:hypothetical protein
MTRCPCALAELDITSSRPLAIMLGFSVVGAAAVAQWSRIVSLVRPIQFLACRCTFVRAYGDGSSPLVNAKVKPL